MNGASSRRQLGARAAMLIDGGIEPAAAAAFFTRPAASSAEGRASSARGAARFIDAPGHRIVLKHYHRGGLVARLLDDRYLWLGEARVRAFVEFRLLARLHSAGLPVPRPLAARYARRGIWYRCDLVTERIGQAVPLSARLREGELPAALWQAVGAVIGALHRAGVDHADLNAHNILLDTHGQVSVVDFDRGTIGHAGGGGARNLARLERSLLKVTRELPAGRFTPAAWGALLAGYARGGG